MFCSVWQPLRYTFLTDDIFDILNYNDKAKNRLYEFLFLPLKNITCTATHSNLILYILILYKMFRVP